VLVQCWQPGDHPNTSEPSPSRDDVKLMETGILSTISWRMNPVTAHLVARDVLGLLPSTKDDLQHQRTDDVGMLICIATRQQNLLHDTPSTIAFAAVLAASTYLNLSTEVLWGLVGSIEEISRSRVAAHFKEMESLLNFEGDTVVACTCRGPSLTIGKPGGGPTQFKGSRKGRRRWPRAVAARKKCASAACGGSKAWRRQGGKWRRQQPSP
jgi:hypothetical protein